MGQKRFGTIAAVAGGLTVAGVTASMIAMNGAVAAPGDTIGPINPVTQPLAGHPANSGFLVIVEEDVQLNADEAEGTLALGGDLTFNSAYNLIGTRPTFTVPGESSHVSLFVGGGMNWPADNGLILRLLGGTGFAKIADTSTYDVAPVPGGQSFRIVPPGGGFDTQPRIEGTIPQSAASIEAPVPAGLIDIEGAFALYRGTSTLLGSCAPTIEVIPRDGGAAIPSPFPPGTNGRVTLVPGQTNVLNIDAADLEALAEITFTTAPTATTPLLINISGNFDGSMPNSAGIGGGAAPFILWNFVDATSVVVTGGDSLEGTIYAPRALVNWQVTQNVEGNVIANELIHGIPIAAPVGLPREIHDFPFAAELTCVEAGDATPTPTITPTITPSPTITPTITPTPTGSPTLITPSPEPTETISPDGPTSSDGGDLSATGGGDPGLLPLVAGVTLGAGALLLAADTLIRARRRRRA